MSERLLEDWLDSYLEWTQDQESPEKLHLWTAFAVLSAALRRRIWLSRGIFSLYPNIYVLLVAESARVRKSTAMNIGVNLLLEALPAFKINGGYITGAATPEGIVKQMNRVHHVFEKESDEIPKIKHESYLLIHADELATLFGYDKGRASRMTILLTETYGRDSYMHTTKSDSQIDLKNLYTVLLAGTDPRNLKVLPDEVIAGLIGRIIFVTARDKRKIIAWPESSADHKILREALKRDLETIANLQGEMTITSAGKELFTGWYEKLCEITTDDDSVTDAFKERCHDTALKVGMLISVSRSSRLILEEAHVAGGIKFIEDQLPEFNRISSWASSTTHGQNRAKLIDMIRRNGGVADRRLLIRGMSLPISEFDELIMTLAQEDTIETPQVIGKKVVIKLAEREMKQEPKVRPR